MLTTHRVLPMPETRPTPLIAGVDEAGRGPLAGPVVCAAVVLPANFSALDQLDDSKKLSEKRRAALPRERFGPCSRTCSSEGARESRHGLPEFGRPAFLN